MNLPTALSQLEKHLQDVPQHINRFSTEELLNRPAPGKWSKQEILGHLIDSAINNLKRFTDIQLAGETYQIQAYRQDGLVEVNHYQQLPLARLLNLWGALNRQIVFVVCRIPPQKLVCRIQPQYDQAGIKTLGWLVCDYVAHLQHHLRAIGMID